MNFPLTPERRNGTIADGGRDSPDRLRPILRQKDENLNSVSLTPDTQESHISSGKSVSPKSQVRFSIPDPSYLDAHENDETLPQSPSKIVFPRDSGELEDDENAPADLHFDKRGHFFDMQARVMLDVPEEIWKFHTTRRNSKNQKHHRTTSETAAQPERKKIGHHDRAKSLQAIIMDTVNTMSRGEHTGRGDYKMQKLNDESIVSPLRLPRPEIYLSPESPLNSYRLPIPLEISLPPYLSPVNKKKQRRSVIYDGDGYSQFEEGSNVSSEGAISDSSIESAKHDYSFNIDHDHATNVDETLGIDEHANVNLKAQHRNLRKQGATERDQNGHYKDPIPSQRSPMNGEHIKQSAPRQSVQKSFQQGAPLNAQQGAQQSVQQTSQSPTANRSLQILATPSKAISIPDLENEPHRCRASQGALTFFDKFEHSQPPIGTATTAPDELTISKERGQLDSSFTFPRLAPENDFQKIDSSPHSKEFERRRTMLMEQNLSPGKSKGHRHRRSRSVHNAEDMFAATSTPPKVPDRSPLRPKSPTTEERTVPCSEVTPPDRGQHALEACSMPDEKSLEEPLRNEVVNQTMSEIGDRTEESLKILFEKNLSDSSVSEEVQAARPLSSIHSFKEPISLTEAVNYQLPMAGDIQANLLSPTRSLSNVGSGTSQNSEFSRRSHISSATSQPSNCYSPMIVPIKSKYACQLKDSECLKRPQPKNSGGIRSVYEKRGGETVEVLVLDDEDDDDDDNDDDNNRNDDSGRTQIGQAIQGSKHAGIARSRNSRSYEEATKNYAKILEMCERTANQARDTLMQLIEEKNAIRDQPHRPLPVPMIAAHNPYKTEYLMPSKDKTTYSYPVSYQKNFNRAVRSHSRKKSSYGLSPGATTPQGVNYMS